MSAQTLKSPTGSTRDALIVGAGIGGLAAALALARKGYRVTVLEQGERFGEIGAGIQLSPNASRVLQDFGLGAPLEAIAVCPTALEMRSAKTGALLFSRTLGETARAAFGAPYLHVHRADLHALLIEAAQHHGGIDIQRSARGVQFVTDRPQPRAQTADGRRFTADVLIGADGIKSAVRSALFGPEAPRFTGCIAWRGLIPVDRLRHLRIEKSAALWMGPGAHFVHYYVRGGELLNFVAVVDRSGWEVESWTERGEQRELVETFRRWPVSIQAIVAAADPDACYKWALFDREPMPVWHRGAATLLGDACHATLPFMAQGACMAIEDAAVLAACLASDVSIETALAQYEALRRPRTADVQNTSRINKTLYHLRGPAAWARDRAFPAFAPALNRKLDALFGHDAIRAAERTPSR